MEKETQAWWQYALSLIVFWIAPIPAIVIFNLIFSLINLIVPSFYRRAETVVTIIAIFAGILFCRDKSRDILSGQHDKFFTINTIIVAVLWGAAFIIYLAGSLILSEFSLSSSLTLLAYFVAYIIPIQKILGK